MQGTGLRRRRGSEPAAAASGTAADAAAAAPAPPAPGTIAAAFRNSKGTELRMFAARILAGAGFHVDVVETVDDDYSVLLITMPVAEMIRTAEELGLRKRDLEGHVRTFTADNAGDFSVNLSAGDLFTQSEQILLTNYCLDKIKPDRSKFDDVSGNESLLEWCERQKYLEDVFPLHDKEAAESILGELSMKSPTFDVGGISKIQDYFGDKVALYFAFLTFYTKSLMVYAGAGLAVFLISLVLPGSAPLVLFAFSIFAALWGASLTSLWKRRNIEVVYMWTSLIMGDSADESLMSMNQKEDLRNEFYGEEVSHRITGEKIVVFPKRKKLMMYFLSTAVVCTCLYISCKAMLAALDFEDILNTWLEEHADDHKWSKPFIMKGIILKQMPIVVYLGCLNVLDTVYGMVATKLTDMENHKYHSLYENSHVLKLVLFQFLNMVRFLASYTHTVRTQRLAPVPATACLLRCFLLFDYLTHYNNALFVLFTHRFYCLYFVVVFVAVLLLSYIMAEHGLSLRSVCSVRLPPSCVLHSFHPSHRAGHWQCQGGGGSYLPCKAEKVSKVGCRRRKDEGRQPRPRRIGMCGGSQFARRSCDGPDGIRKVRRCVWRLF